MIAELTYEQLQTKAQVQAEEGIELISTGTNPRLPARFEHEYDVYSQSNAQEDSENSRCTLAMEAQQRWDLKV